MTEGTTKRLRFPWRALAIVLLAPPFATAFYALTQPWARARVIVVWGISRSIEATLLVAAGLFVAFAGGVLVAWIGRRVLAATVHLGTGLLLAAVSWQAFRMVREAGVSALGFIPIASVHPGRGLRAFFIASLWLVSLGVIEAAVAAFRRKPRPEDAS